MSPDAAGNIKGIAVPGIPWLQHAFQQSANPRIRTCEKCGRAEWASVHSKA